MTQSANLRDARKLHLNQLNKKSLHNDENGYAYDNMEKLNSKIEVDTMKRKKFNRRRFRVMQLQLAANTKCGTLET